eukprot:PITA_32499
MKTTLSEKEGGIRKLNKDSESFLYFINTAKLVDIHPKSGAFTWNNRRGGERQIASRLDRFLISESLLLEGVIVESDILPSGRSDHWPISLMAAIQGTPRNKPFRSALDYGSVNKILSLKSEQGDIIDNHQGISTLLTSHLKSTAQEPEVDRSEAIAELIKFIPKTISNEQNLALTREISLEEVEEAVKDMPNDKALGPDGFTINFYKACWGIVETDVWEVVEDSRCSASILKSLNSTFLALIPKEEEANTLAKFRPISLCNVIYRIISKVIANRMKPILPGLISEEQPGYVEGRQILHNILLA